MTPQYSYRSTTSVEVQTRFREACAVSPALVFLVDLAISLVMYPRLTVSVRPAVRGTGLYNAKTDAPRGLIMTRILYLLSQSNIDDTIG